MGENFDDILNDLDVAESHQNFNFAWSTVEWNAQRRWGEDYTESTPALVVYDQETMYDPNALFGAMMIKGVEDHV